MADEEHTPEIVAYRLSKVEQALEKLVKAADNGLTTQVGMQKDIEAIRSEFERYRATSTRWIVLLISALLTPILLYFISKIG